jgi:hypothetical protein
MLKTAIAKLAFICTLCLFQAAGAIESNSVVSQSLQQGTITREMARRIYLLEERSWVDGTRVHVYRIKRRDIHNAFVRDVLGMNQQEFDSRWDKLVNAGLAPSIGVADNEQDMLAAIARKPNAVGYLSKDFIILNARGHDVRIIKVVD